MEILLNLAWALCSLGLVWFWARTCASEQNALRIPLRTQLLAVAMVVLLLLPVISLSDDLMAAQGPAETDTCLRRSLQADAMHPSVMPAALSLPEREFAVLLHGDVSMESIEDFLPAFTSSFQSHALDSRPPPAV